MTHKHHIPLLQIVAIVGLLVTIVGLSRSVIRLIDRKSMLKTKKEELIRIQNEQETLKNRLSLAQTPEFIEKEAREKLNLGKSGETIILVELGDTQLQTQGKKVTTEPNWKKWLDLFF